MQLYGVALAAQPQKGHQNIIDVTCTAIAVSDQDRKRFSVVEEDKAGHKLSFQASFDMTKPAEVSEAFIKTVDAIDSVVALQKQSLEDHHLPYRPVALNIGQDSRMPVDADALSAALFGKTFSSPAKAKARSPKRKSYSPAFLSACEKLPNLMEKECTLQWNSFTPTQAPADPPLTALDWELIGLRPSFKKGDASTRARLTELAESIGREASTEAKNNAFAMTAPPEFRTEQALQDKYPSLSFFHWDPAFEQAFHRGFEEALNSPYTRSFKLPLDPPSPPFATPCADRVVDQLQVAAGQRDAANIEDLPDERRRIAELARGVVAGMDRGDGGKARRRG